MKLADFIFNLYIVCYGIQYTNGGGINPIQPPYPGQPLDSYRQSTSGQSSGYPSPPIPAPLPAPNTYPSSGQQVYPLNPTQTSYGQNKPGPLPQPQPQSYGPTGQQPSYGSSQPGGNYQQIQVPQQSSYGNSANGFSYSSSTGYGQSQPQPAPQPFPSQNQYTGSQTLNKYPLPQPTYGGSTSGGSSGGSYGTSGGTSGGSYGTSGGTSGGSYGTSGTSGGYGTGPVNGGYTSGGSGTGPVPGGYTGGGGGGYGGGGGGIDNSDPCFRRFPNCIVVNAQPYERRSTVDVKSCKDLCLSSQSGLYTCKSFVYDTQNRVCDLFGHTGNQYPARLLQFNGRDYYEPTGQCGGGNGGNGYGNGSTLSTQSPVTPSTTDGPGPGSTEEPTTPEPAESSCDSGEIERYLRIEGFELQGNDDETFDISEEECKTACTNNQYDGVTFECKSFDYSSGECKITSGAAVPTGTGQLQQNPNADYYEKLCVDSGAAANCPEVFDRFPQMILVGFAETVVDASSFEECLDNCLNAQTLYGFNCVSGMFYFEEAQLNCILNTEDRSTQPDLFVEEGTDLVDYFETGCTARRRFNRFGSRGLRSRFRGRGLRGRGAVVSAIDTEVKESAGETIAVPSSQKERQPDFDSWTQWSPCDRAVDGRRARYKRCRKTNLKQCPTETEWCNRQSAPSNVLNLDALDYASNHTTNGKFQCPEDICCAVFGGCRIGLQKSAINGNVRWCTNPCDNKNKQ